MSVVKIELNKSLLKKDVLAITVIKLVPRVAFVLKTPHTATTKHIPYCSNIEAVSLTLN